MPFLPTDCHVGGKIRERRILQGLSQEKLGEAIGVTFQQCQKMERGANRVSASRLYDIAKTLYVPIAYFFEGLDDDAPAPIDDTMTKRETLELVRAYHAIESYDTRRRIFDLTKTLAKEEAKALASVPRRLDHPTTPEVHRRPPA